MALIAQKEEYDKAKQDLEAEKNAMKNVGEKNSELQMEVDRLKQQLGSAVSVSEAVEDLRRLLKEREEEAKVLTDRIIQKEKTLTNTTAEYEDLLKSAKSMSIALKERDEHVQKQSKVIVQFRKEAEVSNYYCNLMQRQKNTNTKVITCIRTLVNCHCCGYITFVD